MGLLKVCSSTVSRSTATSGDIPSRRPSGWWVDQSLRDIPGLSFDPSIKSKVVGMSIRNHDHEAQVIERHRELVRGKDISDDADELRVIESFLVEEGTLSKTDNPRESHRDLMRMARRSK